MKTAALPEVEDDLSRCLDVAEGEAVVITRHGKPAVVLVGSESEDYRFDCRLEGDPRFLSRTRRAREGIAGGKGIRIEELGQPGVVADRSRPPGGCGSRGTGGGDPLDARRRAGSSTPRWVQ